MRARCFKEAVETVAFAEKGDAYLRLRGEIIGVQLRIGSVSPHQQHGNNDDSNVSCARKEGHNPHSAFQLLQADLRRYQVATAGRAVFPGLPPAWAARP